MKDKMQKIRPKSVRYIKLGEKGGWEDKCIEGSKPCLRLGFVNPHHRDCLSENWRVLHDHYYRTEKKAKGKATEITNEIKDFYTKDQNTLWVTFHKRRLFWCFARPEVEELDDGTRGRRVIGRWSNQNVAGEELLVENLSGKLTMMQRFQGTICKVHEREYLIRKINGEISPAVQYAQKCLGSLEESLSKLIRSLGWKDFELLCDLIFTHSGWQRISKVGGAEKSIDLDLLLPVSGKRAFVQVKSQACKETFENYCETFEGLDQYDEMFFVVHTPQGDIDKWKVPKKVTLLFVSDIARLAVASGLSEWIIRKNA
jgi:hypothetical protein